jgi:hypothetical protein
MRGIRPVSSMTFRVQRSTVDDGIVLMLSGDIAGDHTADLETLVDADGTGPIVLDLKEVSVVDRAGVLLLARSEARGSTLLNCPSYVREWIQREAQFTDSEQRASDVRREEHAMASGVAIAAREETLDNQGLKIFFRSWRPPTTARGAVVVVPGFNSHSGYGHFHDLLNDFGKETVMTDMTAWIEARLPGGAKSGADD